MSKHPDELVLESSKQATDSFVQRFFFRPIEVMNTVAALMLFWVLMVIAIPFGWINSLRHPEHPEAAWSQVAQLIFRWYLYAAGVRLVLENAHHLPKDPPHAVFAANHASLVDGFIWGAIYQGQIFALTLPSGMIPWPLNLWLAKSGSIPVARTDEERSRYPQLVTGERAVQAAVRTMTRHKKSLLIFPEGHVERIRKVQRFHTGAVRIALQAGVPLIPITIRGAERVFSPNKLMIWPGTITFRLHRPIDVSAHYGKQADRQLVIELTERVRQAVVRDMPGYYEKKLMVEGVGQNGRTSR